MRVGIMGAGAIGCWVGGVLQHAGAEVTLVGRAWLREELGAHGLHLEDLDAPARHVAEVRVVETPAPLADCDHVLVCVKSAQTEEVARALAPILGPDTWITSLQNGVRNPGTLRAHLGPRVTAGIVDFNVRRLGEGRFRRTMSGPIAIERHAAMAGLVRALRDAQVVVQEYDDLAPTQWTKLLVNLNNAVTALTGSPTPALLASPEARRVIAGLIEEALRVVRGAGVRPAPLRGVPVGLMPKVLRMPTPIVRVITRRQVKVDAEARSSMWEDLSRNKPTEVEFLNGEIVRLAAQTGAAAPWNELVVAWIHEAERRGEGCPDLPHATLLRALEDGGSPFCG